MCVAHRHHLFPLFESADGDPATHIENNYFSCNVNLFQRYKHLMILFRGIRLFVSLMRSVSLTALPHAPAVVVSIMALLSTVQCRIAIQYQVPDT